MRRDLAVLAVLVVGLLVLPGCFGKRKEESPAAPPPSTEPVFEPHVVVATLDTGTNPFHPTWRRDQWQHPSTFIPGFPADAPALNLTFQPEFLDSLTASSAALETLGEGRFPYWVPGTNLVGLWAHPDDGIPIFDAEPAAEEQGGSHSHGSQASSQIAGLGYSMAPDAWLVIMDRTTDAPTSTGVYQSNADGLRWAADQEWIDIIHTNIQNPAPLARSNPALELGGFEGYPEAVAYAVSKGKLVVSAGGNFFVEPTETSPHAGPAGVLVAGANDNCGYTEFSNPDPHVVMDGADTISATPDSYENGTFGGTSSASPRISGYAAQLLLQVRQHFNVTSGMREGALVVLDDQTQWPAQGPLSDGRLTNLELHEVIRKTADPNPHDSIYDGEQSVTCIPQPAPLPAAFYPKMGYGEVSEHTLPAAVAVAVGAEVMPQRPSEDQAYEASERARAAAWED